MCNRAWSNRSTGLAVLGLDEGRPVLLADLSFSRSRVDLRTLLGGPALISDEKWAAPAVTRVFPA